jgi:hypothetical protein
MDRLERILRLPAMIRNFGCRNDLDECVIAFALIGA